MNLEPWPNGPRRVSSAMVFEGTPGAQIIDELAPTPDEYCIPMYRWSDFAGTHLDVLLRNLGIDTLLVGGGSTDMGISSTFDGRDREYNLVFLRDACQSLRPGAHDFCLPLLGAFHNLVYAGVTQQLPTLRFGFIEATSQWVPWQVKYLTQRLHKAGRPPALAPQEPGWVGGGSRAVYLCG